MAKFEISINSKVFGNWKTAEVTRTLDESTGKFRFTSTDTSLLQYPVRAGDAVQILIDGQPVLTGFCEVVTSAEAMGSHDITVAGRDNTCDIIDSSMPDAVKSLTGPLSMKALAEKVIAALGANIKVVDAIKKIKKPNADGSFSEVDGIEKFSKDEPLGAASGKRCMVYLTSFARKRQVYLITDGTGQLIIFRPSETKLQGSLTSGRNIKSSNVTYNHAQRFNQHIVRAQADLLDIATSILDGDPFNVQGTAIDKQIRPSRHFEIQAEETMSKSEADNRAVEELNIRKARSEVYTAIVANNPLRSEKLLWDIGQLVKVDDESVGIQGFYIIRSVSHKTDRQGGTLTTLTMAPPEAYNVRIPNGGDRRKAKQGKDFQVETPPEKRGLR